MNTKEIHSKTGKAASKEYIQKTIGWGLFCFYCLSTLLKCLLDIWEVGLKREECLILQTVHTRDSKRAGIKKALWHGTFWHFDFIDCLKE